MKWYWVLILPFWALLIVFLIGALMTLFRGFLHRIIPKRQRHK